MPLPSRDFSGWRGTLRSKKDIGMRRDSAARPSSLSAQQGNPPIHERLYKESEVKRKQREEIYDPNWRENEQIAQMQES